MIISSLSSSSLGHQHYHPIVLINCISSWWIIICRCLPYQQVIMMLIVILLIVPYYSVMSDYNVDKMSFFLTNRHYHDCHNFDSTSKTRIILMMNDNNNDETRNDNNNKDVIYLDKIKSLIIPSLISSSSIRVRQFSSYMKESRSTSMTTMIYTIRRGGDDDDDDDIFGTEYKDNHPTTVSNNSSRSCTNKNDNSSTITDFSITSNSNSTSSSSLHHKNKLLLKMRFAFSILKMRSVFSFLLGCIFTLMCRHIANLSNRSMTNSNSITISKRPKKNNVERLTVEDLLILQILFLFLARFPMW